MLADGNSSTTASLKLALISLLSQQLPLFPATCKHIFPNREGFGLTVPLR